jgi:hypothetical protein
MLLYVGPDQIIPLSGFIGTIAGLALMFWGKVSEAIRKFSKILVSKNINQE